jgi:adenosylcobinamide-GDP ribazoletransferase
VALFTFLIFYIFKFIFINNISILLSICAGVLLTGAFHEDGFADVCDGFGGGWTKEKILEIMKDSRVGTYGVVGLGLLLSLKFYCLTAVADALSGNQLWTLLLVFATAHSLSRFTAATFVYTHAYVREDAQSKAKPVAKKLTFAELCLAGFFALLPLAGLGFATQNPYYFLLLIPLWLTKRYLGWYFAKWIGGYTGDCLGATQQVSEVVLYLSVLALWRFT